MALVLVLAVESALDSYIKASEVHLYRTHLEDRVALQLSVDLFIKTRFRKETPPFKSNVANDI